MRTADLGPAQFSELLRRVERQYVPQLLRQRFEADLPSFCRYCWPDRFRRPFNRLHHSLFALQRVPPWHQRKETIRRAVAAPRGFAKSTILSFAEVAHDIAHDREAFVVVLSAFNDLSIDLSRDLREQFREPDSPFAQLYGPFNVRGGVKHWEVSVRGRTPVGFTAKSFGTAIRGIKHRGRRPTRVIIDDGEDKIRVRNPDQRKHQWDALTKDILKLADAGGGMLVDVAGTIWLQQAMLSRLMTEPGWRAERWKAVEKWPDHPELWDRTKRIWSDLTLGKHRETAARAFYKSQRKAMDQGAELLDPAAMDLFAAYERVWAEGWGSFLSEYQNDPIDPDSQVFFSERFARCRIEGDEVVVTTPRPRRIKIHELRLFGHWDPAMGDPHGDYAAIVVVGRDEHGYCYILDCWLRKAPPHVQLEAAWTLAERYGLRRMSLESNGFQRLIDESFRRSKAEREARREFSALQIVLEPESTNKGMRIASMEPDVSAGIIQFSDRMPPELFEQFDGFPLHDHDDGPDGVHGAWKGSGGSRVRMEDRRAA